MNKSILKKLVVGFLSGLVVFQTLPSAFSQTIFDEVLHQVDCNNHLLPQKVFSKEQFLTANNIDLNIVVFEGVLDDRAGLKGQNVLFIAEDEYSKYFKNTLPNTDIYNIFLTKFPEGLPQNKSAVYILTDAKDQTITFMHLEDGVLRGYPHKTNLDGCTSANKLIKHEIETAKKRDIEVLWFGDDIQNLQLREIADANEVTVYRRGKNVSKPIPSSLKTMQNAFDPENAVMFNGIPNTKKSLYKAGIPSSTVEDWVSYHNEIENLAKQHIKTRISSKEEFKNELLTGNKDVVVVFAHLKGDDLYIGDDKLTYDEIKNFGVRRTPTNGKRTGLLFICNSGKQNYKNGKVFLNKKIEPLANILLSNGYFDLIYAPDHTIYRPETTKAFQSILKNAREWDFKSKEGQYWWPTVLNYSRTIPEYKS